MIFNNSCNTLHCTYQIYLKSQRHFKSTHYIIVLQVMAPLTYKEKISLFYWYHSFVKWILHWITGRSELERVCYNVRCTVTCNLQIGKFHIIVFTFLYLLTKFTLKNKIRNTLIMIPCYIFVRTIFEELEIKGIIVYYTTLLLQL